MKLTSIGTVGRLNGPFNFTFDIPQDRLPQGGQRTIAGPYDRYRFNPPYRNGMLGFAQEGAYLPGGQLIDAEVGVFEGDTPFFEDFGWLEDTSTSGGSSDEYTSAQAEEIRKSTPSETIEWLKDLSDNTGVSAAVKNIANIAVQRGYNEVKEFLTPQDTGKRIVDPMTGKQGVIKQDPKDPKKFVIQYDDGTVVPYQDQQILVQGKSTAGSNNNTLLIVGALIAAAFLLK